MFSMANELTFCLKFVIRFSLFCRSFMSFERKITPSKTQNSSNSFTLLSDAENDCVSSLSLVDAELISMYIYKYERIRFLFMNEILPKTLRIATRQFSADSAEVSLFSINFMETSFLAIVNLNRTNTRVLQSVHISSRTQAIPKQE